MTTKLHRALLLTVAALALGSTAARASQPAGPVEAANPIPAANIVVALDSLTTLRQHRAGQTVARALREGALFAATERAWSELAATLDLENEAALDALLGRHAMLAIDHARDAATNDASDTFRWALISEVTRDTEDRLRRQLRPVPRAMLAGRALLTLERGAYELTSLRPEPGATHATIVLAPAGSRDWLATVVEALDAAKPTVEEPGLRVIVREGASLGTTFRAEAVPTDRGVRIKIDRESQLRNSMNAMNRPMPDEAPIAQCSDGGAWGLLETLLRRIEPALGSAFTESARQITTGSVALFIWESPLDDRPAIDIGLAVHVTDRVAAAAIGDAAMEAVADTLAGSRRRLPMIESFTGAFPDADRSIRTAVAGNRWIEPGHASIAWRLRETEPPDQPDTWWLAAVSRDAGSADWRRAQMGTWLGRNGSSFGGTITGRVNGQALAAAAGPDAPPPVRLLSNAEWIGWHTTQRDRSKPPTLQINITLPRDTPPPPAAESPALAAPEPAD
ncbi:MAG: hypothetical protein AAFY58_02175 [Planctomycetota bacterium]